MPDAVAYPIVPGSLIVLKGVDLEAMGADIDAFMDGLERAAGHRKFLVLQLDDTTDARVFGPDALVDWLRAALGVDLNVPRETPTPSEFDLGRVEFGG